MVIDLARFSIDTFVTIPIVKGLGKYKNRKIVAQVPDGWYHTKIGNNVAVQRRATLLEVEETVARLPTFRGYPIGEEVVPLSFQNLFSLGYGETAHVHFQETEPWTICRFVRASDHHFYAAGDDLGRNRHALQAVQTAFEKGQPLTGIKGVTPELTYYFFILSLQRNNYEYMEELEKLPLTTAEREKRLKEFQKSIDFRLKHFVEDSGGKLLSFQKYGKNKYTIEWEIGGQTIRSVITDNLSVWDAGYCLSGDDRRHSLGSLISLAKTFQQVAPLHLTRD